MCWETIFELPENEWDYTGGTGNADWSDCPGGKSMGIRGRAAGYIAYCAVSTGSCRFLRILYLEWTK